MSAGRAPAEAITLPTGGPVEVRAAYWLLVMPANPSSSGARVARGPGGEPAIPPGAVWARRFELMKVIAPE